MTSYTYAQSIKDGIGISNTSLLEQGIYQILPLLSQASLQLTDQVLVTKIIARAITEGVKITLQQICISKGT